MSFQRKERPGRPEDPGRREVLRSLCRVGRAGVVFASSLLLTESNQGCTRELFARAPETVVYLENNHTNLSAQDLGFRQGETTPEEAAGIMRNRGLTHVVLDTNTHLNDGNLSALSADYQHSIHLFRDGRYDQGVELDIARGEQPHRYALRVADYGNKKMIMVLIRDALMDLDGFGMEAPRLALVPYKDGVVGEVKYSQLRELERQQGGMQYPLFVGYDLDGGITFIARDTRGLPWDEGYIITWDGGRLRGRPVAFFELMQCDCVGEWARQGDADGR